MIIRLRACIRGNRGVSSLPAGHAFEHGVAGEGQAVTDNVEGHARFEGAALGEDSLALELLELLFCQRAAGSGEQALSVDALGLSVEGRLLVHDVVASEADRGEHSDCLPLLEEVEGALVGGGEGLLGGSVHRFNY